MIDFAISAVKEQYGLTVREIPQNSLIKKNGMKFAICAYEIPGIGNLSTVRMSAMLGLMKMTTVVLTPLEKDAPLFSYDRISAFGQETLLCELYDTCLRKPDVSGLAAVKKAYESLPDHDLGKHWYDPMKLSPTLAKRGKKLSSQFDELEQEYFKAYLNSLSAAEACDSGEKNAKTAEYVDGLFTHGGPSTDQFAKLIGIEEAKELFSKYIFASC